MKTYLRDTLLGGRHILWMNIADRLFSFFLFIIIARNFQSEVYGGIVTSFTLCSVCALAFDFGLPILLQKNIAVSDKRSDEFSLVFSVALILFIPYTVFSTLFYNLLYSQIDVYLFAVICLITYISTLVNTINKALSGIGNFRSQFIAFTIPRIISLPLILMMIYMFGASPYLIMIIMLIMVAVNLLWCFYFLASSGIKYSFSLPNSYDIFKSALPLGLAVIFNFVYDKIDVLIISSVRSLDETALYSAAYGLYKTSHIAFTFMLVPGFTEVSRMKDDILAIKAFMNRLIKIILIICISVAIFYLLASEIIVQFIYTEKFSGSAFVLKILAPAVIAAGLNNLTGTIINAMGYFRIVMYVTLYGLILNFTLNLIYVPIYGITAAAVITLITESFIFLTEYYYLRKLIEIKS